MPAVAGAAASERCGTKQLTVADLLKQYTLDFVVKHPRQAVPQVQSTLAKLSLCRTAALGGRWLACEACDHRCVVYNSCGDRHCPRCGGAKRADWPAKTEPLLLPGVNYFQVVFTLPDVLSPLLLGHRRETYALLMRTAWRALRDVLREQQGIEPAALLVLHTWNQELDHHPHVHAVVPGGGPSRDATRWITTRHPRHRRRTKPYLVDNRLLGRKFREHFCAGLLRLHRQGLVKFAPPLLPGVDEPDFAEWLRRIARQDWNVFIEAPPENSQPQHLVKYLARYLTGGPICDRRLIAHADGHVTFWARSKSKSTGNPSRPFRLPGIEFVRRWSLHILPKGFTKSRRYGGFSGRHCQSYLQRCRQLLQLADAELELSSNSPRQDNLPETPRKCPHCDGQLTCIVTTRRRSWRDLFHDYSTCPVWYQPWSLPRRPTSIRIRSPVTGASRCPT